MSNTLRVFTINTIGDTVLFLGKMFVVVITMLTGMEMLRAKEGLHYIWVPLTLASVFAYLISHCFITVYEVNMYIFVVHFRSRHIYLFINSKRQYNIKLNKFIFEFFFFHSDDY